MKSRSRSKKSLKRTSKRTSRHLGRSLRRRQRKTKTSRKVSFSRGSKKVSPSRSSKTILMIGADWCPYCRNAKPHFARLSKLYSGKVRAKYVDVDAQPSIAAMYRAQTIPTFVFLENKQVVRKYNESDPARLKKEFEAFVSNWIFCTKKNIK